MVPPENVGKLSGPDWERLQELADRFEARVKNGPLLNWDQFLPEPSSPLRRVSLSELVKIDMEARARRGESVRLEGYFERFAELGPIETAALDLVVEELETRRKQGETISLDEYRQRFPQHLAELEKRIRKPAPQRPLQSTYAPPAPLPVGTTRVISGPGSFQLDSSYQITRRLARGAFGEVWKAYAPGGVEVALKIVFGSLGGADAQREKYSLGVMRSLRHPFLLPIHAFWQTADHLIIAMELAETSLREELAAKQSAGERALPLADILRYFREVAEALDFLHERHVLHRDVKPANILISQKHARVADFGLALLVQQSRKLNQSSHCGTPLYTAPEIFWRGKVAAPSDQYSLAASYVETRLGRPLFAETAWYDLMQAHLNQQPDLTPLPAEEKQVLLKALAKDPGDRFTSCSEFVNALCQATPGK